MSEKSLYRSNRAKKTLFKIGLLALLTSCGIMTGELAFAGLPDDVLNVNFEVSEGYSTGALNGQQSWTGGVNMMVSNNALYVRDGTQGVVIGNYNESVAYGNTIPFNSSVGGTAWYNFSGRCYNGSCDRLAFTFLATPYYFAVGLDNTYLWAERSDWTCDTGSFISSGYGVISGTYHQAERLNQELWTDVRLKWDLDTKLVYLSYKQEGMEDYFNFSEVNNKCFWVNYAGTRTDYNFFSILNVQDTRYYAWDYLNNETPYGEDLIVWGESPESESIITDVSDNFTIGWANWDFEWIYEDFVFYFWEANTGLVTGQVIYEPESEEGFEVFNFSDFGFEKNGKYYFKAKARSYYSIEYGVLYTTNLVSPTYWIKIDVEGWEEIFEMPVFEDWYSENVERFATPTAIFTSISGFLSPIFTRIGEFTSNALSFLDVGEAYQTGYDLGKIFPLFVHYVNALQIFFGGFPIIELFKAVLLILIGLFSIKFIFHFIP